MHSNKCIYYFVQLYLLHLFIFQIYIYELVQTCLFKILANVIYYSELTFHLTYTCC